MNSDGDTGAFVRLLSAYEPQIRGSIMVLVPDFHDGQDIMQRVSVVLWRKFSTFEPGTNFLGWAMVVAKLEVKDHWKRQKRDRLRFSNEFVDLVAQESESMAGELDHRRRVLGLCLEQVKSKDRELLRLRYFEGTSIEAIADAVGKTSNAVYKTLRRLRKALIECVSRRTAAGELE